MTPNLFCMVCLEMLLTFLAISGHFRLRWRDFYRYSLFDPVLLLGI